MTFIEREGVYFSGNYRICRTTRADYDCWYFSDNQNGILKRGFSTLPVAKAFCERHESLEERKALGAEFVK